MYFDARAYQELFFRNADPYTELLPVERLSMILPRSHSAQLLEFVYKELDIGDTLRLAYFLHLAFCLLTSNIDDKISLHFKLKDSQFRQEISIYQLDAILQRFDVLLEEDDLRLIVRELSDRSDGNLSYELYKEIMAQLLSE